MQIPKLLAGLGLEPDNTVVIGSGILNVLGLRSSNDIDMVVTSTAFERLSRNERFTKKQSHGREILADGLFEIGTSWDVLGSSQTFNDLQDVSTIINGVRYITIEFLLSAKKSWLKTGGRPKDFADVDLIEVYLGQKSA